MIDIIRKTVLFIAILAIGLISLAAFNKQEDGPKVTICHISPGNPQNTHSITKSINALPAHLTSGDSE
jgi:hypothetical protein